MCPKISVIMPVYNAEKYVRQAVNSILSQTFTDYELIVIDDGSRDKSFEIISQFNDSRIIVHKLNENKGYPFAMNVGLDMASGEFIARMDADDISVAKRLEKQILFLNNHPDVAFVGTWRYWIGKKNNIFPEKIEKANFINEDWNSVMEGTRKFSDPSVIVRRNYINEAGGYRTYQRSGQDVDLWLRILEKHPVAVTLPEYLYGRRLIPGSITYSGNTHLLNKIPRLLAQDRKRKGSDSVMRGETLNYIFSCQEIKDGNKWRINMLLNTARIFYKAKEFSSANSFAKAAFIIGGWHPKYAKKWAKCIVNSLKY